MTNRFSLAHLTTLGCTPPEMTYLAARAGYDFVSLRPIYMGLPGEPNYALAENKQMMRETKAALIETGVNLLDIELARICDDVDPKEYVPAMEVAAELGGRHVLSSIWTNDRNLYMERFIELCELAKPFGLTIELEYVPIASVTNLAETLNVLRAANQENAGLMIDIHHFHRAGDKIEDLDAVPHEWFRFLHLCDAPAKIPASKEEMIKILREERLYIGEGCIDIASIVERIPEIPYSIELPHNKRAQELGYEEHARRCLQTAKAYFEAYSFQKR
ncbi:sugar phosphate isomerase/epimerase family protein [Priestia endophytica]|uniref:Sugar phosphate isomerase/epimerase n=1 Tax=Priestia endophytica DSM 13796 TaxID=1121089 RepID=A0A1I6BHI7_9BACI|nr:sugar phosphate isomerase/epimerase [Priestia endophytica]KYG25764.1 AP endonuclease [Priestia endophytica]MBG9811370.1 AP endonuclease [Priestia endophytica]SFQ80412.1 Sugar phosphate isomerase/epimerase [Priestia endophytica DSM 13796]